MKSIVASFFALKLALFSGAAFGQTTDLRPEWKAGDCYHYEVQQTGVTKTGAIRTTMKIIQELSFTVLAGDTPDTKRVEQRFLSWVSDTSAGKMHLHFDSRDVPKPGQKPTGFQAQWEKNHHMVISWVLEKDGRELNVTERDDRADPSIPPQSVRKDESEEDITKRLFAESILPVEGKAVGNTWHEEIAGSYLAGRVNASADYTFSRMDEERGHPCEVIQARAMLKDDETKVDSGKPHTVLLSGTLGGTLWMASDLRIPLRRYLHIEAVSASRPGTGMRVEQENTFQMRLLRIEHSGTPDIVLSDEAQPADTSTAIKTTEAPTPSEAKSEPLGKYPETQTRILSAKDIQGWDEAKLRYAINEMYARHGADFKDKAIKNEFQRLGWYRPVTGRTYDMAEADFDEIEKRNVRMLGEWKKNAAANRGSSSSNHPQSATVVDSPEDKWYGNIRVEFPDGHSEVWTKDGFCSDPHVSSKGDVGWVFGNQCNTYGRRIGKDTVKIQSLDGEHREFQPNENGPFIMQWAFVDNDTAIVIEGMQNHGASSFIKYDLATGRVLGHVDGYMSKEKMPKWAQPFAGN